MKDLNEIIKEDVKKRIDEMVMNECEKNINYYYTNAVDGLNGLIREFKGLPSGNDELAEKNISLVENILQMLGGVYSGK